MPVEKYRSVADMPRPSRSPDDPANLRETARLMSMHLTLVDEPHRGVRRFHSIEEANEERDDPYRAASSADLRTVGRPSRP